MLSGFTPLLRSLSLPNALYIFSRRGFLGALVKQGQPWLCRKEKDPLKPKHPTTAFFAFCNSRRPALLEAKTRIPEVCLPPALLAP